MNALRLTIIGFLVLVCCASGREKPVLKLDRHDLTVLGVMIGSSAQEVGIRLGKGPTFKVGHGDEAEEAMCYRSAAENDDTVVVFYFGALGGWADVTRISVSRSGNLPWQSKRCSSNSSVSRNTEFLRGLKLGSTIAEVIRALGAPTRRTERKLSYYVSHNCVPALLMKQKEGEKTGADSACEVVDSVEAKFAGEGGLEYVSLYHFVDR